MKLSDLDRINDLRKSRERLIALERRVTKGMTLRDAILHVEREFPDERITSRVHAAFIDAFTEVVGSDVASIDAELASLGVELS